jgi:quercetin dioxygenase-like cupin family protein
MPAELIPAKPIDPSEDPPCRTILPAPSSGWQLAMGEWELRQAGFGDCHPHDEVNYVLEGTLIVSCDGDSVEAGPGDVVRVPGGHPAYYRAPHYARMVYVYGPNPEGRPSTTFSEPPVVAGQQPGH